MTDLSGAIFYMAAAYLAGEVVGWTLVRLMHRMGRRGRS